MFRKRKNPFDMLNHFDSMFENFDSMFSPINSDLIFGKVKTESGSDESGNWTKQTFNSEDGSFSVTSIVRTGGSKSSKHSDNKLDELKQKLELSVENQNFEEAVKLRDEIKKLEKNKDKIDSLKSELDKSIKEQNFEKSIELRDKIKSLQ